MFYKIITCLALIISAIVASSIPVLAVQEFSQDFRSTYRINQSSSTQVTHEIIITNNLSHLYTTKYSLQLSDKDASDIKITSDNKPLPFDVLREAEIAILSIKIPHPSIGLGKQTQITISYNTDQVVDQIGKSWEINIPRLAKANETTFYSRKLLLPKSLAAPLLITPSPSNISSDENYSIYEFVGYHQDNLSLLIGQDVSYQIDLTYFIKNPTSTAASTEIALPPDTNYQQIVLQELVPQPLAINLDEDGNWLARYSLKPYEEMTVKAKVYATVNPLPKYPLSLSALENYEKNQVWDISSPIITSLSQKLRKPREIYDYLALNMQYDYSLIGKNKRPGASKALDSLNSAICTEFTDSFVALSRAVGIPSKEVVGFAYTTSPDSKPAGGGDLLHAWPTYYDQSSNTWIQVDPTWASTTGGNDYFSKLDYSHITFVLHGKNYDYPLPAGAYKQNAQQTTVKVELANSLPEIRKSHTLESLDNQGLVVKNTGNISYQNESISHQGRSYLIPYLPPYATIQVYSDASKQNILIRFLTWLRSIIN